MADEDFGTVNVQRQQMARELDALKQRYLDHHATIARLEADAPSEQLASRYHELRVELESALDKVDELVSPGSARTAPLPPLVTPPPRAATAAGVGPAGFRPPPVPSAPSDFDPNDTRLSRPRPETRPETRPPVAASDNRVSDVTQRIVLIALASFVVLSLLGFLAWKYSRRRASDKPVIVEQTKSSTTTDSVVESPTHAAVAADPAARLAVSPDRHDFGTIRKGTRAVRQFSIENHTASEVNVAVSRSVCRCLWFDYDKKIAANGSTVLAVTVDGAKAKAGELHEQLKVTAGTNSAGFNVDARIQ